MSARPVHASASSRKSGRFDLGAILRSEKSFSHPLIGQPWLNALGLHLLRVKGSDASVALRLRRARASAGPEAQRVVRALEQDGVAVCPGFLPDPEFRALAREVSGLLAQLAKSVPLPTDADPGFGPKRPFPGGFDRFDGGSLNRFASIDARTPHCSGFIRSERVLGLCEAATTLRPAGSKFWIQQLIQGGDDNVFDIQKELHRDTFHAAYKLWYFLDDVAPEHGPFEYVPGSQRMSARRLWWEYAQSTRARSLDAESRNGSFRVSEAELARLELPQVRAYPVPANTLLIADVRGFHRRGRARSGAVRNAIHVNLRPHPFRA
jgi:hypothetical protein